jgi:hypothetical protein
LADRFKPRVDAELGGALRQKVVQPHCARVMLNNQRRPGLMLRLMTEAAPDSTEPTSARSSRSPVRRAWASSGYRNGACLPSPARRWNDSTQPGTRPSFPPDTPPQRPIHLTRETSTGAA